MGTRADFYIGRDNNAVWLGSIAWDGYADGIPDAIKLARTDEDYRVALFDFAQTRDDWTDATQGWPWPWKTSRTTDRAYTFFDGATHCAHWGGAWYSLTEAPPWAPGHYEDWADQQPFNASFRDMSDVQNVTLGARSGVIVLGG